MISFLRRALSSWIVLGLFGLILVSFVITGMFTDGTGGLGQLGSGGSNIARIGSYRLTTNDASQRLQAQLDAQRQQQPGLDMAQFVRSGAVDQTIEQIINSKAFEEFGRRNGMVVSKRLVDAELADIPAFKGPTGQFDRNAFLAALQQRKLTEAMLREDIAREKMVTSVITPAAGAARAPIGLITPYANLLLERRNGLLGFVPVTAVAGGGTPTDAEVQQFYQRNSQRYVVPERRVIKYAAFDRARFADATPSEAEIAALYKANAAQYGPSERRIFSQVIVPAQDAANRIAAQAKAGTALATAARANGGEATTLAPQDKQAFARLSAPAIANAAFQAAQGAVVGPLRSPLGWHVLKVDSIDRTPGKPLAAVRSELVQQLSERKQAEAVADFVTKIEDEIGDGATFDEVVKTNGLTAATTPAITAGGIDPDNPAFKAPAELQPVLREAFLADEDHDPEVQAAVPNQLYVLWDLENITPSAPRPLAAIRAQVVADFQADRALKAARRIADGIASKANGGTPLAAAVSSSGTGLAAPRPLSARRIDVTQAQQGVPRELALLFSMPAKRAKVLAAPDGKGWYVVWLDAIVPGNATAEPGLIQATQAELGRAIGEEYLQQFAGAIRTQLGVTKNQDAIASLKRELTGARGQ